MIKRLFVLSPHFDDAIFSVGGLISLFSSHFEQIYIINVFSATPPLDFELPPQASRFHEKFSHDDPVAYRRSLDTIAFNSYNVKILYVDALDAIYRIHPLTNKPLYLDPVDIFTKIHACDFQLISLITSKILSFVCLSPFDLVLSPLSIGGHVDHEITRLVGEQLAYKQLLYYEDCPYVFQKTLRNSPNHCRQFLNLLDVYIPKHDVMKKENAIDVYASSIPTNEFIQYMRSHDRSQRCIERLFYHQLSLSNTSKEILSSIPGKLSFNSDNS